MLPAFVFPEHVIEFEKTWMHTHIYNSAHIYIYMYMHTCIIIVSVFTYTHTHMYIYMYTYKYRHRFTSVYTYKWYENIHTYELMCKTYRHTQAKRMSAVKAEDKLEGSKGHGTPMTEFHGFDLVAMGIPIDARPLSGDQHFGKFGYTIRSRKGAVICFSKATFCCLFGEQYLFSQMCRCISFKHGLYLMKASNLA